MLLARLHMITNHRPQSFTGPKRKPRLPVTIPRLPTPTHYQLLFRGHPALRSRHRSRAIVEHVQALVEHDPVVAVPITVFWLTVSLPPCGLEPGHPGWGGGTPVVHLPWR